MARITVCRAMTEADLARCDGLQLFTARNLGSATWQRPSAAGGLWHGCITSTPFER